MRLTRKETRWMQILLLMLIGSGVVIGVHALFFPEYFYRHFFLGADWLPKLGLYNQEMTRTAGALYLGLTVPAVAALLRPAPRLIQMVGAANVVAAFPHMVYHISMEHESGFAGTIPQAGTLLLTVVVGLAIIEISRSGQRRYFRERNAPANADFRTGSDEIRIAGPKTARARLLLTVLSLIYLDIAVQTLFFPHYFYTHFIYRSDWVARLGDYSQHLTFDIGALSFGFITAFVLAAIWADRNTVGSAGWGIMVAALPQVVYHLAELGKEGVLATAVQAGTLFLIMMAGLSLGLIAGSSPQRPGREAMLPAMTNTSAGPL